MSTIDNKRQQRLARARRTHAKAKTSGRPRLVVYRSLKAIYAQIVDDAANKVLCGASNLKGKAGVAGAQEVGKMIADLAQKAKVSEVTFDRNGYLYHGQIKALAEGAREGGLKF
jgi:large subunit ribosomal protein L18